MKKISLIITAIALMLLVCNTGCSSKAKTWSQENKDTWTTKCMKFMTDRGVGPKEATDFCDCMLKKTSDKYTPAEAEKITPDEERKLWQDCDYQW